MQRVPGSNLGTLRHLAVCLNMVSILPAPLASATRYMLLDTDMQHPQNSAAFWSAGGTCCETSVVLETAA